MLVLFIINYCEQDWMLAAQIVYYFNAQPYWSIYCLADNAVEWWTMELPYFEKYNKFCIIASVTLHLYEREGRRG